MTHQKSISAYISTLTISLVLLLCATNVTAQNKKGGSRVNGFTQKADTTALFKGFAVSVDVVGLGQKLLGDYGQYEAALRLNLKDKYFPIVELGYGECNHTDDATDINYKTKAPYGKIGIDFNVLKNKHDIYRLYAGLRYAITSFKYDLFKPGVTDPVWGGQVDYSLSGVKCSYQWFEAVFGVDAKIAGPVHLGWSVRYRSRTSSDTGENGDCWYVPGFGKSGSSNLGGTFNVSIDI